MKHLGNRIFQCARGCDGPPVHLPAFEVEKWPIIVLPGRHKLEHLGYSMFIPKLYYYDIPSFVKGQLLGEIPLTATRLEREKSMEIDEAIRLCQELRHATPYITIVVITPWQGETGNHYCYHRTFDADKEDLNGLRNTLVHQLTQSLR